MLINDIINDGMMVGHHLMSQGRRNQVTINITYEYNKCISFIFGYLAVLNTRKENFTTQNNPIQFKHDYLMKLLNK